MQSICRCRAYTFPHRKYSGACLANEEGPFCGACGQACDAIWVEGGGQYEFWGQVGNDNFEYPESSCCSDTVFNDASLKNEYEG